MAYSQTRGRDQDISTDDAIAALTERFDNSPNSSAGTPAMPAIRCERCR